MWPAGERTSYKTLVENVYVKRQLGRSKFRWEDYIKMDLGGTG